MYLTDKSRTPPGFEGGRILLLIFLASLFGAATLELLNEPDKADASILGAFFTLLILWRLFLLLRNHYFRRRAVRYDSWFRIHPAPSCDLKTLSEGIPSRNPGKELTRLLQRGYLTGITLDQDGTVHVGSQQPAVQAEGKPGPRQVAVRCPACGARCTAVPGKVNHCEYCGTPFTSPAPGQERKA